MPAIAFEYPDDIKAIRDGLEAFLRAEIVSRHEKHADLLENHRRLYAEDGRFSPEARSLITDVRMAAAKAGYYTMCTPTSIGGQGLGYLAWFGAWERIYHFCGYKHWLGHYTISHWAMGFSSCPPLPRYTRVDTESSTVNAKNSRRSRTSRGL